jgi:hypothetical protein
MKSYDFDLITVGGGLGGSTLGKKIVGALALLTAKMFP